MTISAWLDSLAWWERFIIVFLAFSFSYVWLTFPIYAIKHIERIANALERIANKK